MANSEVLIEQLKNFDPALRRKAIRSMVAYPEDKKIVSALCDALGDPNKGVQNLSLIHISEPTRPY